ncbi:hypothetical protein TIFTF001_024275 [Ficus carica]|uniref:Uncharacterized protein n=1 Tax=Ficus carica TaxID=3494 RepID=A0AA88AHP7_FICCA|nr:hypothetical protein TIFTF001_024275 [Ficus carica]
MALTSPENHILAIVPTRMAELKALGPQRVDVGPSFFRVLSGICSGADGAVWEADNPHCRRFRRHGSVRDRL